VVESHRVFFRSTTTNRTSLPSRSLREGRRNHEEPTMSNDTESLMRGAMEAAALAHRLALLRIESEHWLALYLARSKPDQAASASAGTALPDPPPPPPAMPSPAAHRAAPVAQARPAAGTGGDVSPTTTGEQASDLTSDRE